MRSNSRAADAICELGPASPPAWVGACDDLALRAYFAAPSIAALDRRVARDALVRMALCSGSGWPVAMRAGSLRARVSRARRERRSHDALENLRQSAAVLGVTSRLRRDDAAERESHRIARRRTPSRATRPRHAQGFVCFTTTQRSFSTRALHRARHRLDDVFNEVLPPAPRLSARARLPAGARARCEFNRLVRFSP